LEDGSARLAAVSGDALLRVSASINGAKASIESGDVQSGMKELRRAEGYLGELYGRQNRDNEALTLYRRAAFQAQRADAPELLYRWDWATGRLQRKAATMPRSRSSAGPCSSRVIAIESPGNGAELSLIWPKSAMSDFCFKCFNFLPTRPSGCHTPANRFRNRRKG